MDTLAHQAFTAAYVRHAPRLLLIPNGAEWCQDLHRSHEEVAEALVVGAPLKGYETSPWARMITPAGENPTLFLLDVTPLVGFYRPAPQRGWLSRARCWVRDTDFLVHVVNLQDIPQALLLQEVSDLHPEFIEANRASAIRYAGEQFSYAGRNEFHGTLFLLPSEDHGFLTSLGAATERAYDVMPVLIDPTKV